MRDYRQLGGTMNRVAKAAVGLAVILGSVLFGNAVAFGQTPTGGTIQVWGTAGNNGGGSVVFTGAVGDSGKTVPANSSGKPTKNGTYKLLTLKKGTILINTTQLGKDLNNNNAPPTTSNSTTCSGSFVVTDPVPIVSGTKAYAGISGSANITVTFAFVLPLQNGKCNINTNANPIAQYGSVAGTGSVSFS